MGFGILLIGYILAFAFSLSSYYFFADLVGGLVMAYAFSKLASFDVKFRASMLGAMIYSVVASLRAVNLFFSIFPDSVTNVFNIIFVLAVLLCHFLMFRGIISITHDLGLDKINLKAKRNLVVMILYYIFYGAVSISYEWLSANFTELTGYTNLFLSIFEFVWLFMNIVLIGSCLKWIGVEGEEMEELNPTRIRQMNNRLAKLEEKVVTPKEKRTPDQKETPVWEQKKRKRK